MLLFIHVGIALTSVLYALFAYIYASRTTLALLYIFVAATIVTGTILALMNPSHIPEACVTGIVYVQIMVVAIFILRRKLKKLALARELVS